MKKLVIIGGGVAGLAAAWHARKARHSYEITLVEAQSRLGGQIRTIDREGFRLEEGADSFSGRHPAGIGLCSEVGLATRLRPQRERTHHLYIRRSSNLYPVPEQVGGMLLPANVEELAGSRLLSESAKRRLRAERSIPPLSAQRDESIAHFMTRRMGPEVFQLLVEPIIDVLYAGDPARLSVASTLPYLKECEERFGSLTRGLRKALEAEEGPGQMTFPGGMGELVAHLASRLNSVRLITGRRVEAVHREGEGYRLRLEGGQELDADAIISAVPAYVSAGLFQQLDASLSEMLHAIPFASTAVVHLGFERSAIEHPLDGYGYLIPNCENTDILACTWQTQRWRRRAPASHVLLRFHAGRYGREPVTLRSDEDLLSMASEEARSTLGVKAPAKLMHVSRWERAIPQYNVGHGELLDAIEHRLEHMPGLYLAGCSYHGLGIADCIASGSKAARDFAGE